MDNQPNLIVNTTGTMTELAKDFLNRMYGTAKTNAVMQVMQAKDFTPLVKIETFPDDQLKLSYRTGDGITDGLYISDNLAPLVKMLPGIDEVIFNPPATIVKWGDGTKTVVKASGEEFSEEHGLAMAIARKYFHGKRHRFKKAVKDAKRPQERDDGRWGKATVSEMDATKLACSTWPPEEED